MCKILANMTQVSDVAPGPLVPITVHLSQNNERGFPLISTIIVVELSIFILQTIQTVQ
jgi:hypothetical protein